MDKYCSRCQERRQCFTSTNESYLCADSRQTLYPEVFGGGRRLQRVLKFWRGLNINAFSTLMSKRVHTHTFESEWPQTHSTQSVREGGKGGISSEYHMAGRSHHTHTHSLTHTRTFIPECWTPELGYKMNWDEEQDLSHE